MVAETPARGQEQAFVFCSCSVSAFTSTSSAGRPIFRVEGLPEPPVPPGLWRAGRHGADVQHPLDALRNGCTTRECWWGCGRATYVTTHSPPWVFDITVGGLMFPADHPICARGRRKARGWLGDECA